jgi:hypothetical protein
MKATLFNLIFAFSLSIFIPAIVGFFAYSKMSKPLKLLYIYTVVSSIVGLVVSLMSFSNTNNIYLVNLSSVVGYGFLSTVYFFVFDFKNPIKLWSYAFALTLILFLYLQKSLVDIRLYNNELHAVSSLLLVSASVVFLMREFRKAEPSKYSKQMILISFGVFMYYSSSFLIVLFGSDNALISEMQMIIIYLIHSIFYLIFVITLTIAFWLCRKPSEHLN